MPRLVRQWFITYPQSGELTREEVLAHARTLGTVEEYVVALEAHEDGQPHIHAYFKFVQGDGLLAADLNEWDVDDHHGNYQTARSNRDVIRYCTKENVFISNIDVESHKRKRGKVTSETLRTYSAIEALDLGIIHVNAMRNYTFAQGLALQAKERTGPCGMWIWGAPGTGKSRFVRLWSESHDYDIYLKAQNKWFDGYRGENVLLLDDLDRGFVGWHNAKIWADRYKCWGEIKGGMVPLCHDYFVVTSNYHPRDLITEDPQMLAAIERRFSITEFRANTFRLLMPGAPPALRRQPAPVAAALAVAELGLHGSQEVAEVLAEGQPDIIDLADLDRAERQTDLDVEANGVLEDPRGELNPWEPPQGPFAASFNPRNNRNN